MQVSNKKRDVNNAIFYTALFIALVFMLSVLMSNSVHNAYRSTPDIPFVYSVVEVKTGYLYTIAKGQNTLYVYHVPHSKKAHTGKITVS